MYHNGTVTGVEKSTSIFGVLEVFMCCTACDGLTLNQIGAHENHRVTTKLFSV